MPNEFVLDAGWMSIMNLIVLEYIFTKVLKATATAVFGIAF